MPTRTGYSFAGWSGKNLIRQCSKSQAWAELEAKYNSITNEITFANASDWSENDGYSYVGLDIYSNNIFVKILDFNFKVGGLVKGTFTKSGTTNNQFRIRANAEFRDSGVDFDISSFPDGEYSVSFVIKERTDSSDTIYQYENFVVGDIQLERSSSPTTYEPPRTVTSDTQKTSYQDEVLCALWKKNLFVASSIVQQYNNCSWNDTTKTLTFANASSLDARNSYGAFVFIQRVSSDDIMDGYDWSINIAPPLVVGKGYSNSFTKHSQYNYFEIRANGHYADSSICIDMSSFADTEYIVRFKCIASVISPVNSTHNENFTIQDLEIFEA